MGRNVTGQAQAPVPNHRNPDLTYPKGTKTLSRARGVRKRRRRREKLPIGNKGKKERRKEKVCGGDKRVSVRGGSPRQL